MAIHLGFDLRAESREMELERKGLRTSVRATQVAIERTRLYKTRKLLYWLTAGSNRLGSKRRRMRSRRRRRKGRGKREAWIDGQQDG